MFYGERRHRVAALAERAARTLSARALSARALVALALLAWALAAAPLAAQDGGGDYDDGAAGVENAGEFGGYDAGDDDAAGEDDAGGDFGFGGYNNDSGDGGFGFGFGFDDASGDDAGGGFGFGGSGLAVVEISGEVEASAQVFLDDLETVDKFKAVELGNLFSGKLNFSAGGSAADAVVNLTLNQDFNGGYFFDGASPVNIDEAYVRAYFGPVSLEAGLKKITWGKADNQGPLDVVNPKDYSDMSAVGDSEALKISQPMLHAAWTLGFSKIEAVFVPVFQANRFATSGRWKPARLQSIDDMINGFLGEFGQDPASIEFENEVVQSYPDSQTLEYAQAGVRFTTTVGPADVGVQYYYGRVRQLALDLDMDLPALANGIQSGKIDLSKIKVAYDYNPFHQIGVDYAQVIAGFNLRAELAANLTSDFKGDDPAVYNPTLAGSLGFDRSLPWGLTLNLQCNTSLVLAHDGISDDLDTSAIMTGGGIHPDVEANANLTSSRVTCVLSKNFLRDELEVKAVALWGIEDHDFLIMPQASWTKNDLTVGVVTGFFGGDRDGGLGQYGDNSFVTLSLGYSF